ncbi:MAG: Tim44 protein [Ramlibacter sp.]|nr:Tim44 protein [Ramlibacter sp.]MDB5912834.1 Tim44 protein [Ramlibacter sp.]
MKFWTVVLTLVLAFGTMDADAARRFGGGGSIGRQSGNVTQRNSVPPASPTAPSNVQRPTTPQPAPAAVPQAPRRPWAGMLGGLAAGLGLAWLAHSLGFGAGFGNILLVVLLVVLAMVAFAAFRRRQTAQPAFSYAGASADSPVSPPVYNPAKVGNDASARPWEQQPATSFEAPRDAGGGIRIGSGLQAAAADGALEGSQNWGVPPGFDADGFLAAAKRNFVTLQDAWDRSDTGTLRTLVTDQMLGDIRNQIAERDRGGVASQGRTEVVMLEAQLLGIEELATEYMASVEFSGMIREEPSAGPSPFREAWNMVKPKDNSAGWLVAGVQALQ